MEKPHAELEATTEILCNQQVIIIAHPQQF